ncbi:hypothetical protein LTR85_003169 [Meristemomyces frigidus]|nr:hypothetical protein LTR85_003169 [Meristemomyces frigidus]
MDSPKSPPGSVRRHGRNISHPILRRSTKGPLDAADDPLAGAPASPSVLSPPEISSPTVSAEVQQAISTLPEPALAHRPKANVDLTFLQDPSIYHTLPTEDVAPPFIESEQRPPPGTPLADLLQHGHFRRAADRAAYDLVQCAPNDAEGLLQLLYTRLACLILISRPDLAAQEAASLSDLLARNPPVAKDIVPLIPWELRLLLVRLQSIGATDGGRRGIMALYGLAAEVRATLKQDNDDEVLRDVWPGRLRDLGLRVADALVEMGELETANRHLETLTDADEEEIAYRRALLRIRVGDVTGARICVNSMRDESRKATFEVLLKVADGDFSDAADSWQDMDEQGPDYALIANNLAVCMLYTGHITSSRRILEDASAQLPGFSGLLFNLSTVYELCTERAIHLKAELAQTMAAKTPQPDTSGWEKTTLDFKL